ncbi:hypothetical protein TH53_15355 [Pedobacter lusitanus]|uniref:Uncharacterized protein n=1 Tax=Pedobacter lusitanus TaxID=1503925 RepID=A0A0D0GPD8_9SPHI|nr:DUF6266 family protein [Pedobacter lusitanus]KIO76331.1 hypothetical protein TH53_15355 [Pedobacter lusitanus]
MAIVTNSYLGNFRGKIGNMVIYPLNGQTVARSIGISHKPITINQLTARMGLKMMNVFFRNIKAFIRIGFELEARGTTSNAFNMAIRYNSKKIKGVYPDIEIDFEQILVSKGVMPVVKNAKAKIITTGLKVSWDSQADQKGMRADDQVLLLVYFPGDRLKTRIFTSEVRRAEGKYTFKLDRDATMRHAHIYLSFISDNCKSISDSLYLGEVSWDNALK